MSGGQEGGHVRQWMARYVSNFGCFLTQHCSADLRRIQRAGIKLNLDECIQRGWILHEVCSFVRWGGSRQSGEICPVIAFTLYSIHVFHLTWYRINSSPPAGEGRWNGQLFHSIFTVASRSHIESLDVDTHCSLSCKQQRRWKQSDVMSTFAVITSRTHAMGQSIHSVQEVTSSIRYFPCADVPIAPCRTWQQLWQLLGWTRMPILSLPQVCCFLHRFSCVPLLCIQALSMRLCLHAGLVFVEIISTGRQSQRRTKTEKNVGAGG